MWLDLVFSEKTRDGCFQVRGEVRNWLGQIQSTCNRFYSFFLHLSHTFFSVTLSIGLCWQEVKQIFLVRVWLAPFFLRLVTDFWSLKFSAHFSHLTLTIAIGFQYFATATCLVHLSYARIKFIFASSVISQLFWYTFIPFGAKNNVYRPLLKRGNFLFYKQTQFITMTFEWFYFFCLF